MTPERPLRGPDWTERAGRLQDTWALARADMADASFWVRETQARQATKSMVSHYGQRWLTALKRAMAAEVVMEEMDVPFHDPHHWTAAEKMGVPKWE